MTAASESGSANGATTPQDEARAAAAELVLRLFARLEGSGLPYARMRNHERFPSFGNDVDLVLRPGDLDAFRALAAEAAAEAGFDAVTECGHSARSGVPALDFEMFRFYRLADRGYIKVDTFHGLALLGQPLLTAEQLLGSRVRMLSDGSRASPAAPSGACGPSG